MISKGIVIESFAVTDMTAITSAVLFRSDSKGSGFHANERPGGITFASRSNMTVENSVRKAMFML